MSVYPKIATAGASTVRRVMPSLYLVELAGYLSRETLVAVNAAIERDRAPGPVAVLYQTTDAFTGYDPSLRTTQNGSMMLRDTVHIGVITSSLMLRMVVATLALGLRAATRISMVTYDSVPAAISGAEEALAKARRSRK